MMAFIFGIQVELNISNKITLRFFKNIPYKVRVTDKNNVKV